MIGKLLGSVAGSLLDKVGLGKIAPFVKMGLNAITGNWAGVAKDVFSLVSNFKGNFNNADKNPPLGGFEKQPTEDKANLNEDRMSGLFGALGKLFKALGSFGKNGDLMGSLGKIFSAFQALEESMSNNQLANSRRAASQLAQPTY